MTASKRLLLLANPVWEAYMKELKPELWYRLNEASGSVAKNDGTAGSAADGTLVGGPTMNQVGQVDRAYLFDGVSNEISAMYAPQTFPVTYMALMKRTFVGNGRRLITADRIRVEYNSGTNMTISNQTSGSATVATWPLDTWQLWHFVVASSGFTVYVNGGLLSTKTFTPTSYGAVTLYLGSRGAAGYWSGMVDELAIFERVLSVGEMLRLAQLAKLV